MTTLAVGGDAFARHLAEHRASALGNPVTEAHKITNVRYVPGAKIIRLEHRTKMLCRWRPPIGCRSASGRPRPVSPRPMTFPRGARWSERQDKILKGFSREFSRWAAGAILATPCQVFTAQASLPVGGAAPGWRVGIPVAKTKASMANIAKTESEARRPSSRDCSFSATMRRRWQLAPLHPRVLLRRSVSEMKGMPFPSSTCAFDLTSSGMPGLSWMPAMKDPVSAEIRTAPASAVPMRGTEVGDGVLQPADLAALFVGHGGDGDGAELRGERPDPEPGEQHRPR